MKAKILNQLLAQYQERHGQMPAEIVVHPVALAALAMRRSVARTWQGIPVKVAACHPAGVHTGSLGVIVADGALRGFDL